MGDRKPVSEFHHPNTLIRTDQSPRSLRVYRELDLLLVELDTTHGSLELRIKTPYSFANAASERNRTTNTDENTAAASTVNHGVDEAVEVFDQLGAPRDEGDTWREVHSIKRFGGRASVKYGEAQASGITLGNESGEKGKDGGQRS